MKFEPISFVSMIVWIAGIIGATTLVARWSHKGSNDLLAKIGGPVRYATLLIAGSLIGMAVFDSFARGLFLLSAVLLFVPLTVAAIVMSRSLNAAKKQHQPVASQAIRSLDRHR